MRALIGKLRALEDLTDEEIELASLCNMLIIHPRRV